MSVEVFLAVFILLTLSELGDKTQLAVITLTAESKKPLVVFIGAIIAFMLINGVGVLIGELIIQLIPYVIIRLIAGTIFIIFGVITLIKSRKSSDEDITIKQHSSLFLTAFSFVSLAELGDKTQIITIVLVATYQLPFIVFLGVLTGLALVSGISVFLGDSLSRLISQRKLHLFSGILFIVFGLLTIFGVF